MRLAFARGFGRLFFFWRVLGRFAVQVVFGVVCIGDVDLMGLWLYLI